MILRASLPGRGDGFDTMVRCLRAWRASCYEWDCYAPSKRYSTAVRIPVPPFTQETAKIKVQAAEDAWNTRDPEKVSLAYTKDSEWRNRDTFLKGRAAIKEFLTNKWENEKNYRLKKHYFTHTDNKIAVTFQYEYQEKSTGQWFRAYGNEHWTFDENGYMAVRNASINDVPISESERKIAVETPGDLSDFSQGTHK